MRDPCRVAIPSLLSLLLLFFPRKASSFSVEGIQLQQRPPPQQSSSCYGACAASGSGPSRRGKRPLAVLLDSRTKKNAGRIDVPSPGRSSLHLPPLLVSASPSNDPNTKKPTFVDPIVERARQRAGVPAVEEAPPQLFEEMLLQDMQNVLLALERRVREGPSALASHEVDDLTSAVDRIVAEMKRAPIPSSPAAAATPAPAPPRAANNSPSGHLLHAEPEVISSLLRSSSDDDEGEGAGSALDTSDDEGPAYRGRGGMGQPQGTVNTYVIPGMDEMSAEEYQQTLQQSIIERQRRRRASGVVGNLSSTSYLDSLKGGGGGGSGGGTTDGDDQVEDYE